MGGEGEGGGEGAWTGAMTKHLRRPFPTVSDRFRPFPTVNFIGTRRWGSDRFRPFPTVSDHTIFDP